MNNKIAIYLTFIMILTLSVGAVAETKIGIEIYPDRIAKPKAHNEWISTSIIVDKEWNNLTLGTEIKTWIFGTNGLSWYPSSTKFRSWVKYGWRSFSIKFEHYCRHYFHQFEDKGSEGNKLTFEYEF